METLAHITQAKQAEYIIGLKGVCDMEKTLSISNRLAGMTVGFALIVVGLGFMVLGVSLLPVIGILIGAPILAVAWRFLNPKTIAHERIAGFKASDGVMFHPAPACART